MTATAVAVLMCGLLAGCEAGVAGPGDSLTLASGISLVVPEGATVEHWSSESEGSAVDHGLADKTVLRAASLASGEDVHLASYWRPDHKPLVRGVLRSFKRVAVTRDGTVDVRWRLWDDGNSTLAVVTRLPGSLEGIVIVNGVERVQSRDQARKAVAAIWRELSISQPTLPESD